MRALTAAATRMTQSTSIYRRMSQPWQLRSLSYYDVIGEIRFASQFYAKLLSRVRFYPARQLEDGTTEPITSGLPVDLLHRIQDPGGGRSRLQYDYGRMMFVTGEGILFGDRLDSDEERWRFLWKDEIKFHEGGIAERVRFDKQSYDPPEFGIAYRMWTPHPRHSDEADSPLHAVLDIAEELLILTSAVRSTAVSRMTNGMLLIPTEASPNPQGDYLGDEDPQNNPFMADYMEHVSHQIEEPGSAEAAVAFTMEVGYDYIDRVRWMATHDPQTDYMEKALREECVDRLAIGMDFPPEFLKGMTDANHWTARQVVFDMWRSYGSPVAERLGDDLADSYLRPNLEENEYSGWENVVIAYDDSKVVIPPDMTEIAKQALELIAVGRPGYRALAGIDDKHAPDEKEEAFLASLKMRQEVDIEGGDLVIPQRGPVAQSNGNSPEDGPPAPSGGREGSRQEARTASARIHGAAEVALMRCRELAGRRIRHKCADCAKGKPLAVVASLVGPEVVTEPLKLVQGGTDSFHSWLADQGFADSQALPLCQQLEIFAARTLFEPRCPDLPSGFVASIEKAQEFSRELIATQNTEAMEILTKMVGGEPDAIPTQ